MFIDNRLNQEWWTHHIYKNKRGRVHTCFSHLSQSIIYRHNCLSLAFLISMHSNFISPQNPRVKKIWLLPFKMKRVLKRFELLLDIFQIQKIYATRWFSWEKIKWLLQNIWNMSWEFQRIKFKVPLKLFFQYWTYLSFIQIIFLQNKNIQKIG